MHEDSPRRSALVVVGTSPTAYVHARDEAQIGEIFTAIGIGIGAVVSWLVGAAGTIGLTSFLGSSAVTAIAGTLTAGLSAAVVSAVGKLLELGVRAIEQGVNAIAQELDRELKKVVDDTTRKAAEELDKAKPDLPKGQRQALLDSFEADTRNVVYYLAGRFKRAPQWNPNLPKKLLPDTVTKLTAWEWEVVMASIRKPKDPSSNMAALMLAKYGDPTVDDADPGGFRALQLVVEQAEKKGFKIPFFEVFFGRRTSEIQADRDQALGVEEFAPTLPTFEEEWAATAAAAAARNPAPTAEQSRAIQEAWDRSLAQMDFRSLGPLVEGPIELEDTPVDWAVPCVFPPADRPDLTELQPITGAAKLRLIQDVYKANAPTYWRRWAEGYPSSFTREWETESVRVQEGRPAKWTWDRTGVAAGWTGAGKHINAAIRDLRARNLPLWETVRQERARAAAAPAAATLTARPPSSFAARLAPPRARTFAEFVWGTFFGGAPQP